MNTNHFSKITLHGRIRNLSRLIPRDRAFRYPSHHGPACLVFELHDFSPNQQTHVCLASGPLSARLARDLRDDDRVTVEGNLRTESHPDFVCFRSFVDIGRVDSNRLSPHELRNYYYENRSVQLAGRVVEIDVPAEDRMFGASYYACVTVEIAAGDSEPAEQHEIYLLPDPGRPIPPALPRLGEMLQVRGDLNNRRDVDPREILPERSIIHASDWIVTSDSCDRQTGLTVTPSAGKEDGDRERNGVRAERDALH